MLRSINFNVPIFNNSKQQNKTNVENPVLNQFSDNKICFSSPTFKGESEAATTPIEKTRKSFFKGISFKPTFPFITAHRGFSAKYPENTMSSFVAAKEAGADFFELDVTLTKDGIPVVIHDEKVDRTTNGKGEVSKLTLEEIKKLDAGSWFSKKFKDEKISTLDEVFTKLGKKTSINVEIKDPHNLHSTVEKQVVELIHKHGLEDSTLVQSFNMDSLKKVKTFDPSIKTAVLHWDRLDNIDPVAKAKSVGAVSFNPDAKNVTKELVDKLHNAGIMIMPYSIDNDTEDNIKRLKNIGVDSVITNHPDLMKNMELQCK